MAKKVTSKKTKAKKPVKKVAKKTAVKRPAAKKVAGKKVSAKSKKVVAKKSAAKKPAAKKVAGKKVATRSRKVAAKKPAAAVVPEKHWRRGRKPIKHVQLRIARQPDLPKKPVEEYVPIDTAKAVAFGMSIVEQMKREAAKAEAERKIAEDVRLARRPKTRKQGKDTVKFPAADLKEFRKLLMEARQRSVLGVNAMKSTGFNESEDHEADGGDGTNQTLRLQALGQMGNIKRVIQQIDEALHRIDDGTYGVCTSCGQLIRKPRLLNQPFVLTCMECQREVENEQGR